MSTLGVAHHQAGTFPKVDEGARCARRQARCAAKDAAYRAALGLNPGEPLPRQIGTGGGGGAGGGYVDSIMGGRIRVRSAPM